MTKPEPIEAMMRAVVARANRKTRNDTYRKRAALDLQQRKEKQS